MTNTTIFAIIALTSILLLGTSYVLAADHGDAPLVSNDQGADTVSLFPSWFNSNLQWYLDGQVDEMTLANAFQYLADEEIVFLDPDKATKVRQLEDENTALKKKLDVDGIVGPNTATGDTGYKFDIKEHPTDDSDDSSRVKVQFHWDEETEQESLHHLRKAYDLNPSFQTKVVQFDTNHDKWIDVLSIDWGSTSSQDCSAAEGSSDETSSCWVRVSQAHAGEEIWTDEYGKTSSSGDPDRPVITGAVPNPDDKPTEEVAFYYNKIASASETVHDLVNSGETSTTGWDEGVAAFTSKNYGTTSASDGVHELGHALGMMDNAIEKEVQTIEGQVAILEELMDMFTSSSTSSARATNQYSESDFQFISRYTSQIDTKIQSLQTGLSVLEDMLSTAGDDAQLANIDLQNAIDENQNTLDSLKAKITQIDADGEFWFTDLQPGY